MTLPEAIKILSEHNRWRVGEIDASMHKPSEITQAIDLVLEAVRKEEKPSCLGDVITSTYTEDDMKKSYI